MRPKVRAALVTVLAIGVTLAASTAPAGARTTGKESFRGQLIAPSKSGTRTVVSSMIVAKGVFSGVGKIVEVANRPGDPDNVNRDNLVFPQGTMHIRNVNQAPEFSVDPQTCAFTARLKQRNKIQGGTRKFRHASGTFTSGVRAWGVLARNPDGSCSEQSDPLVDADVVFARGTLSF
jgi:hypothetical protein